MQSSKFFLPLIFCGLSGLAQYVLIDTPGYLLSNATDQLVFSTLIGVIVLLIADIVNERYGFLVTLRMVTFGALTQGIVVFAAHVFGVDVPPALAVLGLSGVLCGDIADAGVYALMRKRNGERLLSLRTFASNTTGIIFECAILLLVVPSFGLLAPQFIWKFIASLVCIPLIGVIHKRSISIQYRKMV